MSRISILGPKFASIEEGIMKYSNMLYPGTAILSSLGLLLAFGAAPGCKGRGSAEELQDVKATLEIVEKRAARLEEIEAKVARIESRLEELKGAVEELRSSTGSVAGSVEEIREMLAPIKAQMAAAAAEKTARPAAEPDEAAEAATEAEPARPAGETQTAPTAKAEEPQEEPAPAAVKTYHEVGLGETLYRIAKKYDLTVEELRRLNDLQEGAVIYAGQKLLVSP
jgi:LysM repeat protein